MSYSLKNLQLNTAFAHIEKGNYKAAAPIIRRFAEQGDVDAQYQLAFMYEQGLGVKTDFAAAAKWYHAAAEQGDAAAQMNIATLYEDGLDGLPQDYAAALNGTARLLSRANGTPPIRWRVYTLKGWACHKITPKRCNTGRPPPSKTTMKPCITWACATTTAWA